MRWTTKNFFRLWPGPARAKRIVGAFAEIFVERIRIVFAAFGLHLNNFYESLADTVSAVFLIDNYELRGLPRALAFGNAKRIQARLRISQSHDKVNRRRIVGKPHVRFRRNGIG